MVTRWYNSSACTCVVTLHPVIPWSWCLWPEDQTELWPWQLHIQFTRYETHSGTSGSSSSSSKTLWSWCEDSLFSHTLTHTQFVENDIPCVDLCFLMLSPIVLVSGYWSCQHFDIVQSQGQMTKLNRVTVGAMVTLDVHARDEAQASCMCSWM